MNHGLVETVGSLCFYEPVGGLLAFSELDQLSDQFWSNPVWFIKHWHTDTAYGSTIEGHVRTTMLRVFMHVFIYNTYKYP